jgi:diguanylate cyclase (GGDEF)-like protein/PAS domain S-box-containing protein
MAANDRVIALAGYGPVSLSIVRALLPRLLANLGNRAPIVQFLAFFPPVPLDAQTHVDVTPPQIEVENGMALCLQTIYVIPPGCSAQLRNGRLWLVGTYDTADKPVAVDDLFTSIADECGRRAIAILLSDSVIDSVGGVRRVRNAGGIAVARTFADIHSAQGSAAASDAIPLPTVADRHAQEILESLQLEVAAQDRRLAVTPHGVLDNIRGQLSKNAGIDIRFYKDNAVHRGLKRRMVATAAPDLPGYAHYLEQHPNEAVLLAQAMRTSALHFFHDNEILNDLSPALVRLVSAKHDSDEIRVWVIGCGGSDEAYVIAMLLNEALTAASKPCRLRIFATGLDELAAARGRRGRIAKRAISGLSPGLIERYFESDGTAYRARKILRQCITFSANNLINDPPYLRLDLISCRNTLINFRADLQLKLLTMFHRALIADGLLFLGKSGTVQRAPQLFLPCADKRLHLYRRHVPDATYGSTFPTSALNVALPPVVTSHEQSPPSLYEHLLRMMPGRIMPPSVVIDGRATVRQVFGDVSAYLRLGAGKTSPDLIEIANPALRPALRKLLGRVQQGELDFAERSARRTNTGFSTKISILALEKEELRNPFFLISFIDAGEDQQQEQAEGIGRLDQRPTNSLALANRALMLDVARLKARNRELASTQIAIEAASEDLHAMNESLACVNDSLESHTLTLAEDLDALEQVLNDLDSAILAIDDKRNIVMINRLACQLFEISESSLGMPVDAIAPAARFSGLLQDIDRAMRTRKKCDRRVQGLQPYRLRTLPSRYPSGSCGIILMVDALVSNEPSPQSFEPISLHSEEFGNLLLPTINALPHPACVVDRLGKILCINSHWAKAPFTFGDGGRACVAGDNYLSACAHGLASGAGAIGLLSTQLKHVFSGDLRALASEYCCSGSFGAVRLRVDVNPISNNGKKYWLIMHTDLTPSGHDEQRQHLQAGALDTCVDGVLIVDAQHLDMPIVYSNQAFSEITQYKAEQILGRDLRKLFGAAANRQAHAELAAAYRCAQAARVILEHELRDGAKIWLEVSASPTAHFDDAATHFSFLVRDVTDRIQRESALRFLHERGKTALTFADVGTLEWNIRAGVMTCSDIQLKLLGQSSSTPQLPYAQFRTWLHEDDRVAFDDAMKYCLAGHANLNLDYRIIWPDGSLHWLRSRGDAIIDHAGTAHGILCLTQDITSEKEAETRARFLAHHDALTGLPNRSLIQDRLRQAMSSARRDRRKVAVAFIDLDKFKEVNDLLGHHIGDELLKAIAQRLLGTVRSTDSVCRYSGDEFILLLPGLHDATEAARIVSKAQEALRAPVQIENHELFITSSIGIAMYPDDGDSIDVLIRNADAAMYQAKGLGRDALEFFSPQMNTALVERLETASLLRNSLRDKRLELYYQPQIDLSTGALVGIEALVRWHHPQRGLSFPDMFVPIAEDSDLIHEIGEWALYEACAQNQVWQDAGLPRVPIAVNISPIQFRRRNLIEKVSAALHRSGLAPEYLELELTERVISHNTEAAAEILGQFHRMKLRLAIDDFGTGYSSLTYLYRFPFDRLKIDRSFVRDIPANPIAATIIRSVVSLARGLGLQVVAEGVETEAQAAFLRTEGCSSYQGFLCSPALPADAFAKLLPQLPVATDLDLEQTLSF